MRRVEFVNPRNVNRDVRLGQANLYIQHQVQYVKKDRHENDEKGY